MKSSSRASAPSTVKRTVPPGRLPNAQYRTREYLTEREVEPLMKAAGNNRHGHRDATMILIAFRHGLRAAEVCDLRWDQVDFDGAVLHVRRVKNGTSCTHPLQSSLATAAEGKPVVAVCLRQREAGAIHDRWLCQDDRAGCPPWARP